MIVYNFFQLRLKLLILTLAAIEAAPIASVHMRFVSPPHTYEHGYVTDGMYS